MNQFKGTAVTRMAIVKNFREESMSLKEAYNETMKWYGKNPDKSTEEAIEYFEQKKVEMRKVKKFDTEALQKVLKHK